MEVPGDEELEGILENAATAGSVQFESLRGRRAAALGLPMTIVSQHEERYAYEAMASILRISQVKKCVGVRGSAEYKAIASELARCLEKI
ncbi:hypothetical protein BWQ96_10613 [Gracilariopsis chorda]|uniref:Uncharacterized protein n=1 Tax=Gracilariopsis chorda TaxID=448386 RepID=A0A2V3IC55_9FLOR|nr:hypothetical protein BWQ96_10613 [Gracilariopsis chorda]|eukprot:PXF39687.1 hypothetical protein BWQ96_10613 [Gracilariopsis chorda]